MELWYTEKQTPQLGITMKVAQTLHTEKSAYQQIDILETEQFGRMLVLDGMVMTTEVDEFVYHEMIAHVALHTHPHPENVLVVGGGDGGVIREVIKHPGVKRATLAEIDRRVVELSRQYLPQISSGLSDERVTVQFVDGVRHIEEYANAYDVIIIDSTEPVGAAVGLFQKPFYEGVFRALKADGIMAAQTESPWFNRDLIRGVYRRVSEVFPLARLYAANVPTYPSGLWTFTIGSKTYDPLAVDPESLPLLDTKYYTPALHRACFQLPEFVAALTREGDA
ncbi:polyamine aminopropyltransferase [Numidum massiliense]|uniref:polyamine aminopropyltransferase n=1 Tax=Numidum massiliense TaxID=1522315 RepID=UPI0006D55299|nr:polyamine aminopropyltransferase [Numidum massiliense]